MKPKILIDAIALLSPLTGIGRYTYEISKSIKNSKKIETSFYYGYISQEIICSKDIGHSNIKSLKEFIGKSYYLKKLFRRLTNFYALLSTPTYDLYWQPNFIPNTNIKAKKVVTTVHDFSFILHREYHPKERIEYFENNFFQNIGISDVIITGSNYSKNEILQKLDFNEKQVKVIYHGVDHDIFKVRKDLHVDFSLPQKFILSVGSIEPRKNLIGLLQAYDLLDEHLKEEYKLVLVGFKGWENKELMTLIEKNKENIAYLGFISDEELSKVYNLASLFVFASFYEGFGLPPLEALACGTPVVSSNLSSMPEVCEDSAVYFDPYHVSEIKEKIELVLKDTALQKRLIVKGLVRAKNFTWEKSAEEHLKIFQEVLQS